MSASGIVAVEQGAIAALEGFVQLGDIGRRERPVRQLDQDLVALAGIAHVGAAALDGRQPRAPGVTSGGRLGAISANIALIAAGVERVKPHEAAAHHLEGDRRAQEADRRADAGIGRTITRVDAELLREPRGMQRRAAAEGDQSVLVVQLGAALDGVHARGVGHVLLDHLGDAEGRHVGRRGRAGRRHRASSAARPRPASSWIAAAGKAVGIDAAQHDVGVGHGGLVPPRP